MGGRRGKSARVDGRHNGHLPPSKAKRLLQRFARLQKAIAEVASQLQAAGLGNWNGHESVLDSLTPREKEVALLFAQAPCDKTVAAALGTSVWTVRNQITQIRLKLGVQSREELV